jgi:D-3-phosphoglycerate dehydrogenase / 2-oxoglutarate reductase
VIGQIGTLLGEKNINIANFALGRNEAGAVAAVNVDESADKKIGEDVMKEIRALKPVKNAWLVRV